jgi:hypothetical protein
MSLRGTSLYELPLEQLTLNEFEVPFFLDSVCAYIREFSGCIGIFRQCGQHLLMSDLGIVFMYPVSSMPPCSSVYDAAAFLKKWLRALPVPLLTPAVINANLDLSNPDSVRLCLRGLSTTARRIFAQICTVVESILAKTQVNQMSFQNLSFCFFENITQNSKDLSGSFPFRFFYQNAMLLLNEQRTDFDLDTPISPERGIPADEPATVQPSLEQMWQLIETAQNTP